MTAHYLQNETIGGTCYRLRVEYNSRDPERAAVHEIGQIAIADEQVTSEDTPHAQVVEDGVHERIVLTVEQARWMRDVLTKAIEEAEAELALDQAVPA